VDGFGYVHGFEVSMDLEVCMDLRCAWVSEHIIIINGDNISAHYKPPPHKRHAHGS
jgi:hypothetical protein